MTTRAIWLSYDLGVRGDYASLYAWLDDHSAKECGDSLAFLNYSFKGDLETAIEGELQKVIDVDKRTRIYLIYRDVDAKKNRGIFLFGGRRAPPWSGYSEKGKSAVDEDA